MKRNLIFDIGMRQAQDTEYYLKKGFQVIAIESDPALVQSAYRKFHHYIESHQLQLIHGIISDHAEKPFFLKATQKEMRNFLARIMGRKLRNTIRQIEVKTRTLADLVHAYGVPAYCKIDTQNQSPIALDTLEQLEELPAFVSVESECSDREKEVFITNPLSNLRRLRSMGYRQFKLVDRPSLNVLSENEPFYPNDSYRLPNPLKKIALSLCKMIFKVFDYPIGHRQRIQKKFSYDFPDGSRGPFGDSTDRQWMNYEQAKRTLQRHRKEFFQVNEQVAFQCDWHAKM